MSSEDTVAVRLDNIFLYMVRRAGKVRRAYYEIQASIAVEISVMEAENALVNEKLFSR
jgi:ATP-dependent protease HslVU (ClpYQ) ATPase subunit